VRTPRISNQGDPAYQFWIGQDEIIERLSRDSTSFLNIERIQ
jgi:hypothetical protein